MNSNNMHARWLKWLISLIGMVFAGCVMLILVMMNIWVAFEIMKGLSDPQVYTIGFNIGVLASFFLMTTFGAVLWHSPVPSVKKIIKESNDCRACAQLTEDQNSKIQKVCDDALINNKRLIELRKQQVKKELEEAKRRAKEASNEPQK